MSTIFPRRERRENTADESFVDLEAEGPMTSSPAKEITPLPPVPPLLNLNRSYSDPQLVYGAQVYPQGRSPTPYSSNSPNASGMISASQSQDDAMPHSGSGVDSRAHPADHGLLATVQMDKAEVAATVGPLITVGMQNLTKAQTAVDKVVASEAWSVVKENVTAILAPAKDVGLILDSITKYIPALVAAKSLFTVIIKHELERYENDKNILVVYHIMSIFWFTMCDLQAIFRADRIQTTLDIFFQDVEKTTWDFGNFREVYYRHGHFARSLRSSEYRKKLVSFALEFINHKANLQFILTEGSAIQLGDLTADTPLEVYIVKQVQNNGGEKVLQDKMFLNAIAKNSFNMEEISPQLQASLRQGLDEALSANLPMFTLKVVAAQKEISEAIERSTKSILQQLNSGHSSSVWLSDFSGRQVSIPWQRCRSWQDLCLYLDVVFEGIQESRFIRTRSFGIHIPNQGDLLSHESWNSWVSAIDEDLWENPPTLELYAIMKDDSDRCPHCNITHPATKPLPDLGHQQCLACKGTFLERFEHEVVKPDGQTPELSVFPTAATPPLESSSTPHRLEQKNPIDISYSGTSSTTTVEIIHSAASEAPSSSVSFLPQRVQVIRRRPHSQRIPEVEQPSTDPAPPLSAGQILPISTTPTLVLTIKSPAEFSKSFFHKVVMFGLPNRYLDNSPQPQASMDSDGSPLAYAKACDTFYKCCSKEWREMGTGAAALFSVLFTILQISSAAYDPVVRTVVQLSIVCLFFGSIYAFILSMVFGKLEQAATGPVWMRNARRAPIDMLWNPWIMFSLPLYWIIWGVFYFAIFIMAFLWRSGAMDEPDENSRPSKTAAYGPRIATTLVFTAGTVYLGLVIVVVRKM
ncbi:hypothetical protein MVEN_00663900 [Mycena venus]|uniref:Ubiquitin-like domain-containing protein n=1 Tax=Mycena venus TaxID=2733690 RepID=A0A8H7D6E5_9AGAR|nr:hypothetical protein MVEN_00663900 [Mycena venus]